MRHSLSTPITDAAALGDYTRAASSSDVDIGLLAELGTAVTRGAEQARADSQAPTASHAGLAVPSTAPPTPETIHFASPVPLIQDVPQSLAGQAAEVGTDVLVAGAVFAAGAIAGASAGENIGGDLAINNIGSIALPLGQAVGRNIGRFVGGATAATAIRCASRSRAPRSGSSVRFSPDIPFSQSVSVSQRGNIQSGEICGPERSSTDLITAVRQQQAGLTATQDMITRSDQRSDQKFDKLQQMIENN